MKNAYKTHLILAGLAYALLLLFLTSCEQEEAVVELNAAPGGGTVTTYKAYELASTTEDDIYGRIVFYKDNSDYTLVQVSVYNTDEEVEYGSTLFKGSVETENPEVVQELYALNGTTGEFTSSKFLVIADKTFYDGLDEFDAHLKIMAGETLVSAGNIGKNAQPVAEGE